MAVPYIPQPQYGTPQPAYPGLAPPGLAPPGAAVPGDYQLPQDPNIATDEPLPGTYPPGTYPQKRRLSQTPGQGLTPLNRANIPAYRQGGYYGGAGAGGIPTIGGGGGGSLGGGGGAGGGGAALLEYGRGLQAEQHLPGMIGLAGRETAAIEEGARDVPYGPGGYSLPLMQYGLERQIAAPGMSPVEYTQAKRRITQGFGAQTGALASAGAKGGYFSPASVAQAGGGAPAQQLGQGLAELEAKNAEIQRRERESGVRTLASQYGTLSGQALGPRSAYLARVGQYQTQAPVQYQGIQTTKPSSTYPGPIGGSSQPSGGGGGFYVG